MRGRPKPYNIVKILMYDRESGSPFCTMTDSEIEEQYATAARRAIRIEILARLSSKGKGKGKGKAQGSEGQPSRSNAPVDSELDAGLKAAEPTPGPPTMARKTAASSSNALPEKYLKDPLDVLPFVNEITGTIYYHYKVK